MTALSRIFASVALFAAAATPASADIRAFNAAVQKGDYAAAVAAANETWPAINRASPDAASIAREFGWVAMLADEPATALTYAKFLVEQGASLTQPDSSPVVSRVLFDWASLASATSQPSSQPLRARLLASLQQRAAAPGRDLISVRAAHALHAEAWAAGDWVQAYDSALLAIRFLDEAGASQSPVRFELRRGVAASSYLRVKSSEAYNAIYDVAAALAELIAVEPPGALRDRYAVEYFAAVAWGDVMYSALDAARQKATPNRGATTRSIVEMLYPAPGDVVLPRCRIVLDRKFDNPGFPFEARYRDLGGEVIYAFKVEPGGSFSNPRVLASAPHAGFARQLGDSFRSWRWRVEGPAPPNCRMPETHILTFEFGLGR